MAQRTIGIGAAPNDDTGDTLRVAGDKINDNFTENYASIADLYTAVVPSGASNIHFQNFDPTSTDPDSELKWRVRYDNAPLSTSDGTPEDYNNHSFGIGIFPDDPADTAGLVLNFESKFTNDVAANYGTEWHLSSSGPGNPSANRVLSAFMPYDQDLRAVAGFTFKIDAIYFADWLGTTKVTWDLYQEKCFIDDAFKFQWNDNNVVIMRQRAADGSTYKDLPYYNSDDQIVIPGPIKAQGPTVGGQTFYFQQTGSAATDNKIQVTLGVSVTGHQWTHHCTANSTTTTFLENYNSNTGSGNSVLALTNNNSSGDMYVLVQSQSTAKGFAFGYNGGDDRFEIGPPVSFGFGAGPYFTITYAAGVAANSVATFYGSVSQVSTWNDAGTTFTGFQGAFTNTASHADSRLMRMSVGGTQVMSMYIDGSIGIGTDVFGTLGGIDWPGKQLNISDNVQAGLGLHTNNGYAAIFWVDEAGSADKQGFSVDMRLGQETLRVVSVLDDGNLNKTCATWLTTGWMGVGSHGPSAVSPLAPLHVRGSHVADKGLAYFDAGADLGFIGVSGAAGQLAGLLINEGDTTRWLIYRDTANALILGSTGDGTPRLTIGLSTSTTTTADKFVFKASTTGLSSLNIPSGTAPTSPVDGDVWSDGSDLFKRFSSVTYKIAKVKSGELEHPYMGLYFSTPALTTITTATEYVKVAGTTSTSNISSTMSTDSVDNRIKYTGTVMTHFHIVTQASVTLSSGTNQDIGIQVWKYDSSGAAGTLLAHSEARTTIAGTNVMQITTHADVMLDENDYIEMHIANHTNTNDVTVDFGYMFAVGMR